MIFRETVPFWMTAASGRSYLYANTQVRIESLSNRQNFNTLLRICKLQFGKLDEMSVPNADRHYK